MNTLTVILIAIAIIAVAFGVFMYIQRERTRRLRGQFGPEYDRLVRERGNQRHAEEELGRRQKRLEKLHVRELSRTETDTFSGTWRLVQEHFVDAPRDAVKQADQLIREVMTARGYPVSNFEQRAADISVDHPLVVENYRAAHDIAVRDAAGKSNTEQLRQAMVHYRALFEDLVTTAPVPQREELTREEVRR